MTATLADCTALAILGGLEPGLLARVAAQCRIATFGEREVILREGTVNDHLHFILSGRVQVYFDITHRSQPIEIGAGAVFGEMSVIDELPVSAYVVAAEPCRILLLPSQVFWSDVVTAPGVARAIMCTLSTRLRDDAGILLRAMQDRVRHQAMEQELALAREVQMGMLRRATPWFPDRHDFTIFATIEPAKAVGGDFYDAFLLDQDHLVLVIGDVAGKGVGAAMFMVRALTMLRSMAVTWRSLPDAARSVNHTLANDNEATMFLTLFMAVLDLRTGMLDYINFGHLPPVVRSPDGSVACHQIPPGVVFGLVAGAAGATGSLVLGPGTTLVLYSDGVTEAVDQHDTQFRLQGLLAATAQAETGEPEIVAGRIAAAVAGHAGGTDQADDITILAVAFNGSRSAG